MVSRYEEEHATADNAEGDERHDVTAFDDLCVRYSGLEGLGDLDAEQTIEVFRDVLDTMNGDLNNQQRA